MLCGKFTRWRENGDASAADDAAAASGVAPTGAFECVPVGRAIGPETFVVFPHLEVHVPGPERSQQS